MTKEFDSNGKIIKEITETIEEEDNTCYPFQTPFYALKSPTSIPYTSDEKNL